MKCSFISTQPMFLGTEKIERIWTNIQSDKVQITVLSNPIPKPELMISWEAMPCLSIIGPDIWWKYIWYDFHYYHSLLRQPIFWKYLFLIYNANIKLIIRRFLNKSRFCHMLIYFQMASMNDNQNKRNTQMHSTWQ